MFTTCIHCTGDLGRNEAFEAFPVGSRLAFDPAKGRLWVICRHCDRWNLSPLEERWEAIDAAEGRFRDSRLRVSTDEIGMARLKEGVDLIRIGKPMRPEMAAWRYGDQFGRRRNRQLLITGAAVGGAVAIVGGIMAIGASAASFAGVYGNAGMWSALVHGNPNKVIGRIPLDDGTLVTVKRKHARMSALENLREANDLHFRLESEIGTHLLRGEEAMRVAARVLPTVNRFGGSVKDVRDAVEVLELAGGAQNALGAIQREYGWRPGEKRWGKSFELSTRWADRTFTSTAKRNTVEKLPGTLHAMRTPIRLAVEMALHEESERRAMDGELDALERAWRDAEQIAKIADDMFVPADIAQELERLREGGPTSSATPSHRDENS